MLRCTRRSVCATGAFVVMPPSTSIPVFAGAVVYGVLTIDPQIAAADKQIALAEHTLATAEKDINGIEGDMDKITAALAPLTAVGLYFQELQKKGYILDRSKSLSDLCD